MKEGRTGARETLSSNGSVLPYPHRHPCQLDAAHKKPRVRDQGVDSAGKNTYCANKRT